MEFGVGLRMSTGMSLMAFWRRALQMVGEFILCFELDAYFDFHATVLRLLCIDDTKLTFYHNGIGRRLTDVHGHVIDGTLA